MIKKLQKRFIIITIALLALVVLGVFGTISVMSYYSTMSRIDSAMSEELARSAKPAVIPEEVIDDIQDAPSLRAPRIGSARGDGTGFIPVAVFKLQEDGSVIQLNNATALIDEDVQSETFSAVDWSKEGVQKIPTLGLLYKTQVQDADTLVAFADMSEFDSWKSFSMLLVASATVTLVACFAIAFWLSRWVLRPAKLAWNRQRRFIADASHDLKTPLTVILANTSIMQKHSGMTIDENQQWLESTQVEAQSMQELINGMLELAQIDEQGVVNKTLDVVNLSSVVSKQILQFESVAFERGITFQESIHSKVLVKGNAQQINHLVETLIDNACKYADDDSIVSVALNITANTAIYSVSNQGSPILEQDLPHVFERFYRTDLSRSNKGNSHGLGLAIAKEIAEAHKGTISVESSKSCITFTVILPL